MGGFDGTNKKWKRSNAEEESATPYPPPGERLDDTSSVACMLVARPIGEGPDTKRIKKKMHWDGSTSDFFHRQGMEKIVLPFSHEVHSDGVHLKNKDFGFIL